MEVVDGESVATRAPAMLGRPPQGRVVAGREPASDARAVTLLDELVATHQKSIFRQAWRLLGDADEAANATQDCFLRAYRALDRCPPDATGQARWLSRLACNLCLDRLRSRKWRWWRQLLGLDSGAQAQSTLRSPERQLLDQELSGELTRALEKLSARQRAVFVLRHYEDMPLDEIAERLSLNTGTVKAHLARAVERLRKELEELRPR